MTKTCTKCELTKDISQFQPIQRRGKTYYLGMCRECSGKYQRNYKKTSESGATVEQKRQVVQQAKDVPCMDCGNRFPPECMDFDHVRGVKRAGIAKMVVIPYSMQSLREEMAKCDVVCACCHRIRTNADKDLHHQRIMAGRVRAGISIPDES
jgi:hypothetical protein